MLSWPQWLAQIRLARPQPIRDDVASSVFFHLSVIAVRCVGFFFPHVVMSSISDAKG
jgi:hypothetical protein